ncbi:VTT domain-containing protein [Myxococcota bacterium]|nr:VTT domain-containing protein [Myxococcota bacterium]
MAHSEPHERLVGPEPVPARARSPKKLVRLGVLVVFIVALAIAGKRSGLVDDLDIDALRQAIDDAGPWGVAAYLAIFVVGVLVHVPGWVFLGSGILAFGKVAGFFICLFGAVLAVSVSFFVVRAVGGRAIAEIERPVVRKVLAKLDSHPVRTVALLRMVLWVSPPLNYTLALTNLRFRDYLIGSAIGLFPPIVAAAVFFDWLLTILRS